VIVLALAAFVVLGLGGAVVDHLFPGPVGAATSTTTGDYPPPLSTGPVTAPAPVATAVAQLPARASALMGLQGLSGRQAPPFRLVDQYGRASSLESFRGKVVVVSFFDATCNDICPVLETELAEAYRDLGAEGARVELVTINTDPLALAHPVARPADEGAVSTVPGWSFLTGSLAQLGPVWTSYGVSVQVQRNTKTVSHNDLLYFIDPAGRWRSRATPFADESSSGSFSLPRATEAQWAAGIASESKSLLGLGT
jgi:cytochrome oxidase Cu insertion factor (SCO1/SenC/PrrC family)